MMNDIEKKYFLALGHELRQDQSDEELANDYSVDIENGWIYCGGDNDIDEIKAQYPYKIYIADFCIATYFGKNILVEIDGHDTHKSKEQRYKDAVRERFLIKEGFLIIRFTGSEIYVNARECVKETLEIVRLETSRAKEDEAYYENRLLDFVRDIIKQKTSQKGCKSFIDGLIADRKRNGITAFFDEQKK